jgi:hypothetical protein
MVEAAGPYQISVESLEGDQNPAVEVLPHGSLQEVLVDYFPQVANGLFGVYYSVDE